MIAECRLLAEFHTVSKVSEHKVHDLAQLMVDAYKGTTDWEEGDDESVAAAEIQKTLDGDYGTFLESASGVIADSNGRPISALFTSVLNGNATVLFVYTAKQHAGLGHASRLIRNAAFELISEGFETFELYVSEENPAKGLYERLGFLLQR